MERCPVCNARLNKASTCPRCQADLSLIIANALQSEFWLQKAQQYWLLNNVPMAMTSLDKSLSSRSQVL